MTRTSCSALRHRVGSESTMGLHGQRTKDRGMMRKREVRGPAQWYSHFAACCRLVIAWRSRRKHENRPVTHQGVAGRQREDDSLFPQVSGGVFNVLGLSHWLCRRVRTVKFNIPLPQPMLFCYFATHFNGTLALKFRSSWIFQKYWAVSCATVCD